MHKFIACILLFNTSALLPMSKFVCCGTVVQEEKQQHPVLIKQVFDFEVRTSKNPNSPIRFMPHFEGEPGRTFSRITLAMGSTSIKSYFGEAEGSELSDDVMQDPYKRSYLKYCVGILKEKLKEPADSHSPSGLNNCRGKLTVTCPPKGMYLPNTLTYEIELKETALKEEEHKNND